MCLIKARGVRWGTFGSVPTKFRRVSVCWQVAILAEVFWT